MYRCRRFYSQVQQALPISTHKYRLRDAGGGAIFVLYRRKSSVQPSHSRNTHAQPID
jgi:hypothetical protein